MIRHEEVMVFGAPILVAVLEGEKKCVSPRHISEAMGLNWSGQRKQIMKNDIMAKGVEECPIPSAGGLQMTFMMPIEMMSAWMLGINPNRCKPECRAAILKYRAEAYAVLDAWFRQNARAAQDPGDMMAMMRETIQKALAPLQVQLEAVVIDNKTMKPKVEAYDTLTAQGQQFMLTNVAHELGVKRNVLTNVLIEGGVLERTTYNNQLRYLPTKYANDSGLTGYKISGWNAHLKHSYYFTAKGRSLCERLVHDMKVQQIAA